MVIADTSARFFSPRPRDGAQWIGCDFSCGMDALRLQGTQPYVDWEPFPVFRYETGPDTKYTGLAVDSPFWGTHTIVFDESHVAFAQRWLGASGELLEVHLDDGSGSLWVFHVLNVIDALADEASVRLRSSTDGHVLMLHERVSLDAELVQGQTVFRLPSPYGLFLSREFVEAWEREGITGTTFGPRW